MISKETIELTMKNLYCLFKSLRFPFYCAACSIWYKEGNEKWLNIQVRRHTDWYVEYCARRDKQKEKIGQVREFYEIISQTEGRGVNWVFISLIQKYICTQKYGQNYVWGFYKISTRGHCFMKLFHKILLFVAIASLS